MMKKKITYVFYGLEILACVDRNDLLDLTHFRRGSNSKVFCYGECLAVGLFVLNFVQTV